MSPRTLLVASFTLLLALPARRAAIAADAASLAGAWSGTVTHAGETRPIGLELSAGAAGRLAVVYDFPAVHFDHVALGEAPVTFTGDSVRIGPFRFAYDAAAGTLTGLVPHVFVPAYDMPVSLRRVAGVTLAPRVPMAGRDAAPLWTYDAGAPLRAGAAYGDGLVLAGGEDGVVHALDARTGARRWTWRAGGPVRARPVVTGGTVYVFSDDNVLARLDAAGGRPAWRTALADSAVTRTEAFDRFGSEVTVARGAVYVGTHAGDVVALDAAHGTVRWRRHVGREVSAAPEAHDDVVYAGTTDGHVVALDASTGAVRWDHSGKGAVVSTPAWGAGRVIVGDRAYDLNALDARTGEPVWTRYLWGSWVESSATVSGGLAYVGSSDADVVQALDVRSGEVRWAADVFGWTWGRPAVTARSVCAGVSGQAGYPVAQWAGVVALDRAGGTVRWRYAMPAPASGDYGVAGSVAAGEGRVYAAGLDGRVRAFAE